jgi:C-terminal processing protease CtpA/Prc
MQLTTIGVILSALLVSPFLGNAYQQQSLSREMELRKTVFSNSSWCKVENDMEGIVLEYPGIGIFLQEREGKMVIESVATTAAERTKKFLKSGDVLLKINNQKLLGYYSMNPHKAHGIMSGLPVGSLIELELQRGNNIVHFSARSRSCNKLTYPLSQKQ